MFPLSSARPKTSSSASAARPSTSLRPSRRHVHPPRLQVYLEPQNGQATGLTLVVQEAAWQSDNEQLNAGIGEPLDRLSALSRSLIGRPGNVDVDRSELVGAARQLGQLADYIGAGGHFLAQDEVDGDAFARRLAADAKAARAAAGGA